MKNIENTTIYELMAEDFEVYVRKTIKHIGTFKEEGFSLVIEGEDNHKLTISEEMINPCAMESFVDFCRQVVNEYDKVTK